MEFINKIQTIIFIIKNVGLINQTPTIYLYNQIINITKMWV